MRQEKTLAGKPDRLLRWVESEMTTEGRDTYIDTEEPCLKEF